MAGALLLAVIVPFLPFLQVRLRRRGPGLGPVLAAGRPRALPPRPWAFAFALVVMLLAAIPLYLLKIEMIPREAAWLPSLVFVAFLAPARLLTGWAYARSGRRDRPRHWLFRALGRLAIVPAAALYVLVVFLSQYTSWGGSAASTSSTRSCCRCRSSISDRVRAVARRVADDLGQPGAAEISRSPGPTRRGVPAT